MNLILLVKLCNQFSLSLRNEGATRNKIYRIVCKCRNEWKERVNIYFTLSRINVESYSYAFR